MDNVYLMCGWQEIDDELRADAGVDGSGRWATAHGRANDPLLEAAGLESNSPYTLVIDFQPIEGCEVPFHVVFARVARLVAAVEAAMA